MQNHPSTGVQVQISLIYLFNTPAFQIFGILAPRQVKRREYINRDWTGGITGKD